MSNIIEEHKNTIIEQLNQGDYASAYSLCRYMEIKLIDAVFINDAEKFKHILDCLDEIKNCVTEKVKYPKKEEGKDKPLYLLFSWDDVPGKDSDKLLRFYRDDLDIGWAENAEIHKSDDGKTIHISKDENLAKIMIDEKKEQATLKISRTYDLLEVKKENDKLNLYMPFIRVTKEDIKKMEEPKLQKFIEKVMRTSYYIGAVSSSVNSLYDIGSQFKKESFVPILTSFIYDLVLVITSPDYYEFLQKIRERGCIGHVDVTDTTTDIIIAELVKRNIIKLDEDKTAFLTNKGDDLIKYSEMYPDIKYLLGRGVQREIEGESTTIRDIEMLPVSRFPLHISNYTEEET